MSNDVVQILFPPGRVVQGSLYKGQDKDIDGRPLIVKDGPNAGKPTVKFFFAVAYAKQPGHTHWSQTDWGAKIWALGHQSFPQGQAQAPTFAWKITDGDSQIPNKRGSKPCDREGFSGHWVVAYSSQFAPRIYTADGSAPIVQPDAVKLGYFVQVLANASGNGNLNNPGVYINHQMVALRAYGPEIFTGPDPSTVGFGQGALPAGASAVPLGNATLPTPPAPTPVPPGPPVAAGVAAPVALSAPPPPAPTPVQPHAGFMAPAAPGNSMAPPPPPATVAPPAAGPHMTAKAGGASYAQFIAQGWTDATLRASGYMV